MTVDKMIEDLQRLSRQGYGKSEAVIYEQMFEKEKPYHTTVENLKVMPFNGDKEKEVVVILR